MASSVVAVCWLRTGDLRLWDNPCIFYASKSAQEIGVMFTWCANDERGYPTRGSDWSHEGTALQLLLGETLTNLDADLQKRFGNSLAILSGPDCVTILMSLLSEIAAALKEEQQVMLYYNKHYEPWERDRQAEVERQCQKRGIQTKSFPAFLFKEPESCPIFQAVKQGQHIFKAFWEGWHKGGSVREAVPEPAKLPAIRCSVPTLASAKVDAKWPFKGNKPLDRRLSLTGVDGTLQQASEAAESLLAEWRPLTEKGAWARLEHFLTEGGLKKYVGSITRDAGPSAKESRLSPYYRLGLLSMVSVYWELDHSLPQVKKWLRRCAWRDYAYWMLSYWKDLPERPMRPAYEALEWSDDEPLLRAWQLGTTGWPLVDAGMRELRQTGYIQQHLRHIVGQFLVEVLGASWVKGEEWFHVCLADADVAINAMMWQHQGLTGVSQWLTGVECHPVRQAKKADPNGAYVRRFCPELAKLPLEYLHQPWAAPESVRQGAKVFLGESYPHRIVVDLERSRAEFMQRVRRCRTEHSECIARGGNDIITCPDTCPVSGLRSIVALTERSVKASGGSKGEDTVSRQSNIEDGGRNQMGKGKGRGAAWEYSQGKQHSPWPAGSDADRAWKSNRPARRWQKSTDASKYARRW
jgi:deoxyribodipyrimidine photo-lyase